MAPVTTMDPQLIAHRIRLKTTEDEIEVGGTKQFCENWFIRLHQLLTDSQGTATLPQPAMTGTPKKIVDCVMLAAYGLQEVHGKPYLLARDLKAQMTKAGMKVPSSASGLSAAIGQNVKKGYLVHTGKAVGKQKAVRVTEKGKSYVVSGFGKGRIR